MEGERKPLTRRPMVLRKLNTENLLMIERGLLGDLPEKLRPQPPVPVRGRPRPTDLAISKSTSFLSACMPIVPDSPGSDRFTSDEDSSPIKSSFSFRDKFSRLSFLSKKDKKWKKTGEEASPLEETKASKRSWFFRHREMKQRDNTHVPIYKRSKSFEFLPRAIEEEEDSKETKSPRIPRNSQSFIYGSRETMGDAWASNDSLEFLSPRITEEEEADECVFINKHTQNASVSSKDHNSSVSTMTSTNSSGYIDIFKRDSVQNLLDEFDKAVDMFSENYLSDCEPYTKTDELISMESRRKSSSFSTLPSPKVVQLNPLKVSGASEEFKKELSVVLSAKKRDSAVPSGRTNRRGSVTDWFVLEEKAAPEDKYRRALKKPTNRVRRMSSTKYWITPEECAVYSREQRPPLVIPRITQYRGHRDRYVPNSVAHSYPEENYQEPTAKVSPVRQYDRLQEWSPTSDRGYEPEQYMKPCTDSPRALRVMSKNRLVGSTENLLIRRPNQLQLQLPASSSGDSLDIEVRDKWSSSGSDRTRKSKSMVAPKYRMRSPKPAPRTLLHNVEHEGVVKRTKFIEGTKKCKKNYTDCYMILTQTGLNFYKDQKTYYASKYVKPPGTPPSPSEPRADLSLMLHNAHIVPCRQMHTKRYARSLILTVGYDQYLIQDETEEGARRWFTRIQNIIYKLGPYQLEDYPTPQSHSSNTDLESNGRTPPPSARHPHRAKPKAGGSSNEDLTSEERLKNDEKSDVKSRLRKFFAKRPSMEVLVKKGIYKDEPVFGQNLAAVCPGPETSPRVPEFVVNCIREIEKSEENMCTDGLYRASGNLSQVQKIRLEIDQKNMTVIESNPDIHVLTGSLKLFFRELKEPLLPCSIFDRILSACSIKPRDARVKEFRDIINSLPQCNRDTLKYLLEHLLRVTQYSEHNRMHTANLAIVFGPTLLWAPAEQAHNIAVDCIQQNNVVDILLTDFKEIFEDGAKTKKKA